MVKIFKYFFIVFLLITFNNLYSQESNLLYRNQYYGFGLVKKVPVVKPKIALVLSGGGSRGAAQVGVLKALEEANIKVDLIVGTSIGSIVGGLYASGYSVKDLDSIIVNTNWDDIVSIDESRRSNLFIEQKLTEDKNLLSVRLDGFTPILPTSLSNGIKILNYLNLLILKAPVYSNDFDNLLIPFRAVCTDLTTGQPVILNKGNLALALRASSSVSFLLKPIEIDSLLLTDGGLVANIPVNIAKKLGADIIIAVNTTSHLRDYQQLFQPWYLADQVVSIPMKQIESIDLELADIVIQPVTEHLSTDFSNLDSLVELGYNEAKTKIDKIKEIIYRKTEQSKKRISSQLSNSNSLTKKPITEIFLNRIELSEFTSEKSFLSDLISEPYDEEELSKRIYRILKNYRAEEKYLININSISFNDTTGQLYIDFTSGLVDSVNINGNEKTKSSIILREIPIEIGEVFNIESLRKGFDNLAGTNLFELTSVRIEENNNYNTLNLDIKEKYSGLLRIGLRADNERDLQIALDLRDENFLGNAIEIGASFYGGLRNRSISFENRANRILNTFLSYRVKVFYDLVDKYVFANAPEVTVQNWDRVQIGEYKEIKYGAKFSLGAQIEKLGSVYLDITRYNSSIKSLSNVSNLEIYNDLFTFKIGSVFDSRNKYPFPTDGILMDLYYETAQRIFGGDLSYSKISLLYETYLTYFKNHTIHPKFIFGFGDETMPLSEQFFLGGQNSFLGLRENDLFGRQIFLASLEYRFNLPVKIIFDTYLSIRYDLGGAWQNPGAIRYLELRHGIGGGISFDTPLGLASFYVGRGFFIRNDILKKPLSFGPYLFYFEIGYPI